MWGRGAYFTQFHITEQCRGVTVDVTFLLEEHRIKVLISSALWQFSPVNTPSLVPLFLLSDSKQISQ